MNKLLLALSTDQFLLHVSILMRDTDIQGDHSPESRPREIPWQFTATALLRGTRHVKCYSYHANTSTNYLHECKYAVYNKQFQPTFSWQDFFPDISPIFSKIHDISLTAVKYPDISRLSRQVVNLDIANLSVWPSVTFRYCHSFFTMQ